ncbi:MAG: STAS domain-containing protein [Rhodocyclaceae bacterium]|nr:STAS domain-containing protein [Rhodocyclaceae bacterium]MDZ4215209.1 STAS domain-containing protein [Rhodocyclaceae bacterium]
MQTSISNRDGNTVVVLNGRFDFNAHREFRETVDQAVKETAAKIHVDLGGVDYLDSSALGMLLMLRDKAKGAGKEVLLANARGAVKQVIEIANFGKLFPLI